MAFQFILGFTSASAVSLSLIHIARDRYDLKNLVVEKQLDKKVVEMKYQNVSSCFKIKSIFANTNNIVTLFI